MSQAVRITQLDGKLPNLALMRLSAWHRAQGDEIVFSRSPYRDLMEPSYKVVYGSAIFQFSAERVKRLEAEFPSCILGGTGTNSAATVEQIAPDFDGLDYTIYPDYSASLGFTQRGCRLSCKFCVVPKKEGKNRSEQTIADIWRGEPWPKHLHLLDNDFFGQPDWRARVEEIRDGGFSVCLNQGINVRLIDQESAEALASIRYCDDQFKRRRLYTAWDNLKDEEVFFRGIDTLERAGISPSNVMAYMLVGFDKNETWDRIHHRFNRMVERGIKPYPMVYGDRRDLKRFQRWAVTGIYRAGIPFDQYDANARGRADPRQYALSEVP